MDQEQQIIDEAAVEAVRGVLADPEYGECYLREVLSSLGVEASESMVEATDTRAKAIFAQLLETLNTLWDFCTHRP